jgi:iron(III) transport system substrate-binding protein
MKLSARSLTSFTWGTLALLLASCASATPSSETTVAVDDVVQDEQELLPEAEADSYVILYSGREESLVQPLIDLFSDETGIEVDIRYAGSSQLAAQLLEEGEQSPAAVFLSQDAGALGALSAQGLFATLPDDITARVDPSFSSLDDTWVGVTGRARVIVYDSETVAVEDLPDTADAIVGPQWSGKVGVAPGNASFQSFVTAYRVLRGEGAADQWVAGLTINDPQVFDKNSAILEAVNEGTIELGLINHYYWYQMRAERGAENMRAALYFTQPGDAASIVNVSGAGILKAQSYDLDAYELLSYLVSDKAQQYFVESTYEYPLVPGIAQPEGLPGLSELATADFDLSDLRTLAQTQELLRRYGLIF